MGQARENELVVVRRKNRRTTTNTNPVSIEALERRQLLSVSFNGPVTWPAGDYPTSAAVGDFDGDGNSDLAVVSAFDPDVKILLGDGSGGFSAPTIFAAGPHLTSIAIGDFNGDRIQDLVVCNYEDAMVSVLLGDGGGGFAAPRGFAAGETPNSVAVADFNNDGRLDLAVVNEDNWGSDNVKVLLGNGSGGFASPLRFSVAGFPHNLVAGDFNNDGRQDVAVVANTNNGSFVTGFLGDGVGNLSQQTSIKTSANFSYSLAVGDFNTDGRQDLAVANLDDDTVGVLGGNGNGQFYHFGTYTAAVDPQAVAIGDFDGDGASDIVATGGSVSVLLRDSILGFSPPNIVDAGEEPIESVVGDFNGDGRLDLAVCNIEGVGILLNGKAGLTEELAESLAKGLAYDDTPADDLPPGYNLGDYALQPVANGSGFFAFGLDSDQQDPVLVLRGTEPSKLSDWLSDFEPDGVGFNQFQSEKALVEGWVIEEYLAGKHVDVVGHSLGGALAQWFAADLTNLGYEIGDVFTFNSPGIGRDGAAQFVPALAGHVTHDIVNGDLVSMVGQAYIAGSYKMYSFSDLNIFDLNKHLLPVVTESYVANGNEVRTRPADVSVVSQSDSVDFLNDPQFHYNDAGYDVFLGVLATAGFALGPIGGVATSYLAAGLYRRGSAELVRQGVGDLVDRVSSMVHFETLENGNSKITFTPFDSIPVLANMQLSVSPSFRLIEDGENLKWLGGFHMELKPVLHLALPDWAGGTRDLPLLSGDLAGSIDPERMTLHGSASLLGGLESLDGALDLDGARQAISVVGHLGVVGNSISTEATFTIDRFLNFSLAGTAEVSIPAALSWVPGPIPVVSGHLLVRFSNDGVASDDFIAGWGTVFGADQLGFRLGLDGTSQLIGTFEIQLLSTTSQPLFAVARSSAAVISSPSKYASGALVVPPETPFIVLTARWEADTQDAPLQVRLPNGHLVEESAFGIKGNGIAIVPGLSGPNFKTVIVAKPVAGNWSLNLKNPTNLGTVTYFGSLGLASGSAAITSPASNTDTRFVKISVTSKLLSPRARIALFYDNDPIGFDGQQIAVNLVATKGVVTYTWDTATIPQGKYHVYALIVDDNAIPLFTGYSAGEITVRPRPVPTITVLPSKILEGRKGTRDLIFTLTLSEPADSDVLVSYLTSDGSATAGSDYVAVQGTLSILKGQQVATIRVPILGDAAIEPNETLLLNLSSVSGAILNQTLIVGTILNDDAVK